MFLLVSVRHVGAHPGEHQHGVSIQISISLGKTFLRISRIRNIPLIWILARVFVYLPPFISQILDFICRTVLIFILIYFEWRDTENQQYLVWFSLRSSLFWKLLDNGVVKKFAILTLKPRSHVRILIHRTWAISTQKLIRRPSIQRFLIL